MWVSVAWVSAGGDCCDGVYGVALGLEIPASFAIVVGDALAVWSLIAIAPASTPAAPMLSPAAITRPFVLSFLRWVIAAIVPVVLEGNLRIVCQADDGGRRRLQDRPGEAVVGEQGEALGGPGLEPADEVHDVVAPAAERLGDRARAGPRPAHRHDRAVGRQLGERPPSSPIGMCTEPST